MTLLRLFAAVCSLLILSVAAAAGGAASSGGGGHATPSGAGHGSQSPRTVSQLPKVFRYGSYYPRHQDEGRCLAGTNKVCSSRTALMLLSLHDEALAIQRSDGGVLTSQHRAELQSKLDEVMGKPIQP